MSRKGGVSACVVRCLSTTTFTSQPESRSSPLTEVILVSLTLHLPYSLLTPFCYDEEKLHIMVTPMFGELLCAIE